MENEPLRDENHPAKLNKPSRYTQQTIPLSSTNRPAKLNGEPKTVPLSSTGQKNTESHTENRPAKLNRQENDVTQSKKTIQKSIPDTKSKKISVLLTILTDGWWYPDKNNKDLPSLTDARYMAAIFATVGDLCPVTIVKNAEIKVNGKAYNRLEIALENMVNAGVIKSYKWVRGQKSVISVEYPNGKTWDIPTKTYWMKPRSARLAEILYPKANDKFGRYNRDFFQRTLREIVDMMLMQEKNPSRALAKIKDALIDVNELDAKYTFCLQYDGRGWDRTLYFFRPISQIPQKTTEVENHTVTGRDVEPTTETLSENQTAQPVTPRPDRYAEQRGRIRREAQEAAKQRSDTASAAITQTTANLMQRYADEKRKFAGVEKDLPPEVKEIAARIDVRNKEVATNWAQDKKRDVAEGPQPEPTDYLPTTAATIPELCAMIPKEYRDGIEKLIADFSKDYKGDRDCREVCIAAVRYSVCKILDRSETAKPIRSFYGFLQKALKADYPEAQQLLQHAREKQANERRIAANWAAQKKSSSDLLVNLRREKETADRLQKLIDEQGAAFVEAVKAMPQDERTALWQEARETAPNEYLIKQTFSRLCWTALEDNGHRGQFDRELAGLPAIFGKVM